MQLTEEQRLLVIRVFKDMYPDDDINDILGKDKKNGKTTKNLFYKRMTPIK